MVNEENYHVISYLTLRKLLGWLGFLLPVILVVGAAITPGVKAFQPSISQYYYTPMRDVFVCILTSFGLFLFTYDYRPKDKWLTNLAGVFALLVAFFSTSMGECKEVACTIHFVSAALFFLLLAYISFFLFTRSNQPVASRTKQKKQRNKIYRICAIVMLACLILLALYFFLFEDQWPNTTAFWLETVALWAFGVSWLVKGETILKDDTDRSGRLDGQTGAKGLPPQGDVA